MSVTISTYTSRHCILSAEGHEFPLTFEADLCVETNVNVEGSYAVITYAARSQDAQNPRTAFGPLATMGTMVRVKDGYDGIDIDQPDSEVAAAFDAAKRIEDTPWTDEVAYAVVCGCAYSGHELVDGFPVDCALPDEMLLFGDLDSIYEDGSASHCEEFLVDGHELSITGIAAMIESRTDPRSYTDEYDLLGIYIDHAMPSVTGFLRWDMTGSGQSDWAEGYIYTTEAGSDVLGALRAEVKEYEDWANGNVYDIVRESFGLVDGEWESVDWDIVGGYYGEEYAQRVVTSGEGF